MAKRPVPQYDFKAFGAAIKAARTERKASRKKVGDEMYISPRYLANIENKGQHPSLQIFFKLMLRYNISVDQFLLDTPPEKDTQWRQLADAVIKGQHEYVLTTHIDKGHIHNHIIFCAVNFVDHHKYVSNKRTYYDIRNMSDKLCRDNGLSVVVPQGKELCGVPSRENGYKLERQVKNRR